MKPVNAKINIPEKEKEVLAFWKENSVFKRSNAIRDRNREFSFYDGPPFANGLPHYGHLLANTIKDVVPRYWNMRGFYVERRFGWDCHGLPVEYEIEKKFDLKGRSDILEMGIEKFNKHCQESVLHYTSEWKSTIESLGRWVDWGNQYRTMDLEFMESVWWVFSELHRKGMVYQGHKVVPYSPRITAVLSNFEANQNYQDVQDPALTVKFQLLDENAFLLAWTTTPWTLIANLGLAVGETLNYAKVKVRKTQEIYYVGEERISAVFGPKDLDEKIEILEVMAGDQLVGRSYQPLLPYYSSHQNAFKILGGDFVSTEEGTGIVHLAPCYGEDDFRVCSEAGIQLVDALDEEARFKEEIEPFAGKHVKEADRDIIRFLKNLNMVFKDETIVHSYPHCERTNTPLIYRAIPAWYIAVEKVRDQLVINNQKINWVPEHLRDGRMGNWLANARDWAVSRNRFWGTPIPIWRCESDHWQVVGSKGQLEELTGQSIDDLHKHSIDELTFPCQKCGETMRRVDEVFDCWFESGSMPYAQLHYPFQNKERFGQQFPADFIAEGLDQTRGWFYTLSVLSTALFGKPAFKNVVVNGMVLAEDGRKMSKRWKNYTPPTDLIDSFGADSVRLYMLNSAILKGGDLRFSDTGVQETIRSVILPLWNAYSFLSTYADADGWSPQPSHLELPSSSENDLDMWILSRLQTLTKDVHSHMEGYRLYLVVPAVLKFIEELTNWYIRLSRRRFWGGQKQIAPDTAAGYHTLYYVLVSFCKLLAPFAPFISEHVYRELTEGLVEEPNSVHLSTLDDSFEGSIDTALEERMSLTRLVVDLGRSLRAKHQLKTRQVLAGITVVSKNHRHQEYLENSSILIKQELNIKNINFSQDETKYVRLEIKPNLPVLGKRLGKEMRIVRDYLKDINADTSKTIEFLQSVEKGSIEIGNHSIGVEDLFITRTPLEDSPTDTLSGVTIIVDTSLTPELIREGLAREIVNRVQGFRKDSDLQVTDRISISFSGDKALVDALNEFKEYICAETLCEKVKIISPETSPQSKLVKEFKIGEDVCLIGLSTVEPV